MDKRTINEMLPYAYDALMDSGIVDRGDNPMIKKTYRGYISSFGAAVNSGSLLAAISFFSDNGGASEDRSKLMKAITYVLNKQYDVSIDGNKKDGLFDFVKHNSEKEELWKERIINAAISLKLSMNLYKLVDKKTNKE